MIVRAHDRETANDPPLSRARPATGCRTVGTYRGIELAEVHRVIAFDEVHTEFQPKIQRFLCRLVGPDEAEDLTQEVFLKISQALPEFQGDSTLSTWV